MHVLCVLLCASDSLWFCYDVLMYVLVRVLVDLSLVC